LFITEGIQLIDTRIKLFYEVVFSRLAFELARKQEKAFWSAERSIPVDVKGSDTESGVWYAEICLNTKIRPALSISLLPGELRVGIVVPESFIFIGEKDLTPAIVGSFGEALDVTRNLPGHSKLFDRMVSDDPFTANWFVRSIENSLYRDIMVLRLADIARQLWVSVAQVILVHGHQEDTLHGTQENSL
jgi:hypothetical protein